MLPATQVVVTPEHIDFTTRVINSALDHWPLVAGMGIVLYWLFPRALVQALNKDGGEAIQNILKSTLNNGGGEIIRRIVQDENAKQTAIHAAEIDKRFSAHEEVEDHRFRDLEAAVFGPAPRRRSRTTR